MVCATIDLQSLSLETRDTVRGGSLQADSAFPADFEGRGCCSLVGQVGARL